MRAGAASRRLPADRRAPGIGLDFDGLETVQCKIKEKARKVVDLQGVEIAEKGKRIRKKGGLSRHEGTTVSNLGNWVY